MLSITLVGAKLTAQEPNVDPKGFFVQFDAQNKPFIQYQVSKGQSLFGIRSRFGLTEIEILDLNPSMKGLKQINIGQWINIPINHLLIYTIGSKELNGSLPVYYKVQPKEGIYSIVRNRTKWSLKILKAQNALKTDLLKVDQILQIGYLIQLATENEVKVVEEKIDKEKQKDSFIQETEIVVPILPKTNPHVLETYVSETRGVAFCPNIKSGSGKMYVLHNKAKRGTYIEVYNPVLERSVLAKVIGRIPRNYSAEIEIVVSRDVAVTLGALSSKFFVYVRQ